MLKIRASQVSKIMPGVRKGWLKSTDDYLFQLWVEQKYGREKEINSKYMEKGNKAEEAGITLLSKITGELYFKNEKQYENEWITGTPDIVKGIVRDIKSSWDVFTFEAVKREEIKDDYYWQLQAYMDLTGLKEASLDYVLIDTPEEIIEREQFYKERDLMLTSPDDLKELRSEVRKNMTFGDIPEKDRLYSIPVKRNEKDIKLIHDRVELCRQWWEENL